MFIFFAYVIQMNSAYITFRNVMDVYGERHTGLV
jgi:hypothetical protein